MRATTFRLVGVALIAALASALVLTGAVGAKHRRGDKSSFGTLKAKMTGAQEVPGPGDEDGEGRALIQVLPQFEAVCFKLSWEAIADPTAAHIHRGAAGVAGDVVVPLFVDAESVRERGCVDGVEPELLREIKRNPREFYVNVHNAEFEAGAIRGQLKRTGHHRGSGKRGR